MNETLIQYILRQHEDEMKAFATRLRIAMGLPNVHAIPAVNSVVITTGGLYGALGRVIYTPNSNNHYKGMTPGQAVAVLAQYQLEMVLVYRGAYDQMVTPASYKPDEAQRFTHAVASAGFFVIVSRTETSVHAYARLATGDLIELSIEIDRKSWVFKGGDAVVTYGTPSGGMSYSTFNDARTLDDLRRAFTTPQ